MIITKEKLKKLVGEWLAEKTIVAAPTRTEDESVLFQTIEDAQNIAWDGFIRPSNSAKEFIFPRHEKLYQYTLDGGNIEIEDTLPPDEKQIILGARPCDAAAFPILDKVFAWDYDDVFFQKRRENTTIISFACTESDAHCFCTSVGLAPDAEDGSDVLLLPIDADTFEVLLLTEKGKALLGGHTEENSKKGERYAGPEKMFDIEKIKAFLEANFDDPIWDEIALQCVGCGACAYSCPTCHCFDIVDEKSGKKGARVRNWDACQNCQFTLHASGHNPREVQGQRQRQRLLHKFCIYEEKFGMLLCTGCGNCARNCAMKLGVGAALRKIQEKE